MSDFGQRFLCMGAISMGPIRRGAIGASDLVRFAWSCPEHSSKSRPVFRYKFGGWVLFL